MEIIFNKKKIKSMAELRGFINLLLDFLTITTSLPILTEKEKLFMEATMILDYNKKDITSPEIIRNYMDDFGFKNRRAIYDYRTDLKAKKWLIKVGNNATLPDILRLKNWSNNPIFTINFNER